MNFGELLRPGGAARVLVVRYRLEAVISTPGSISGHQAEQARIGLGGRPPDGGRLNSQEVLRAKLADMLLLCRDLNGLEESCCRTRYAGAAGTIGYSAIRRLCDLQEGDGEEVADVRPRDYDGRPMDGYVAVRGIRSRYPSYAEIGVVVGRTADQVRGILDDARGKIGKAIRWRAFAAAQEASYD